MAASAPALPTSPDQPAALHQQEMPLAPSSQPPAGRASRWSTICKRIGQLLLCFPGAGDQGGGCRAHLGRQGAANEPERLCVLTSAALCTAVLAPQPDCLALDRPFLSSCTLDTPARAGRLARTGRHLAPHPLDYVVPLGARAAADPVPGVGPLSRSEAKGERTDAHSRPAPGRAGESPTPTHLCPSEAQGHAQQHRPADGVLLDVLTSTARVHR